MAQMAKGRASGLLQRLDLRKQLGDLCVLTLEVLLDLLRRNRDRSVVWTIHFGKGSTLPLGSIHRPLTPTVAHSVRLIQLETIL